jgi:hypothetical protein
VSVKGIMLACDAPGCEETALAEFDGFFDWRVIDGDYVSPEGWTGSLAPYGASPTPYDASFCPAHSAEGQTSV